MFTKDDYFTFPYFLKLSYYIYIVSTVFPAIPIALIYGVYKTICEDRQVHSISSELVTSRSWLSPTLIVP